MKYMIFSLALLTGCSDVYRYECQDPANHLKTEYQPPACEANGTCTKYLIKGESNEN